MTRERWEQALFAHVQDEVGQDRLNQYVLELESENAKLRQLLTDYYNAPCVICNPWAEEHRCKHDEGGNCLLATRALELGIEAD